MGITPRVGLALRSTDEYCTEIAAAILELAPEVVERLSECGKLAERLREEEDPTLKELRFGGGENIALQGNELANWVDCLDEWGRRWHSDLIHNRIALLSSGIILAIDTFTQFDTTDELVVTLRPMQEPRFSWRFFLEDLPIEVFTDPLPLETYRHFSKEDMPNIDLKRQYVRRC